MKIIISMSGGLDSTTLCAYYLDTWHTSNDEGQKLNPRPNETKFWVFVDISKMDEYVSPLDSTFVGQTYI